MPCLDGATNHVKELLRVQPTEILQQSHYILFQCVNDDMIKRLWSKDYSVYACTKNYKFKLCEECTFRAQNYHSGILYGVILVTAIWAKSDILTEVAIT